ncbi:MAG TPA: hypothetical protein VN179_07235 [Solirubrobacterales bacterium]|nr:hypothetical protein [Solirubrobacterales bacterium]
MRSRPKLHLLLPSLLLVLATALVACGGGGESDEDEVVDAIDYALTSTDPKACEEQMTQAFSEQTFRVEGASAVEMCEQNARAEESPNDPVEVTDVEIEGARATADVAFTGDGEISGQVLAMALVEEDGDWKLDEITGFAEFDRDKLVEETVKGFESGESPAGPRVLDCIRETYRGMSRSEFEEIWFQGSAEAEIEILESCKRR